MKEHTKPGGINIITAFTKEDIGFKEFPDFYFVEGVEELVDMYSGWEVVEAVNYVKHDIHDKPHDHHIAALIVRKNAK
jgi:hypothetical protein